MVQRTSLSGLQLEQSSGLALLSLAFFLNWLGVKTRQIPAYFWRYIMILAPVLLSVLATSLSTEGFDLQKTCPQVLSEIFVWENKYDKSGFCWLKTIEDDFWQKCKNFFVQKWPKDWCSPFSSQILTKPCAKSLKKSLAFWPNLSFKICNKLLPTGSSSSTSAAVTTSKSFELVSSCQAYINQVY